jgi:hypothetical protein
VNEGQLRRGATHWSYDAAPAALFFVYSWRRCRTCRIRTSDNKLSTVLHGLGAMRTHATPASFPDPLPRHCQTRPGGLRTSPVCLPTYGLGPSFPTTYVTLRSIIERTYDPGPLLFAETGTLQEPAMRALQRTVHGAVMNAPGPRISGQRLAHGLGRPRRKSPSRVVAARDFLSRRLFWPSSSSLPLLARAPGPRLGRFAIVVMLLLSASVPVLTVAVGCSRCTKCWSASCLRLTGLSQDYQLDCLAFDV